MNSNIPPILPGTKIRVRHHENGDITYVCTPEDSITYGIKRFFRRLFWLSILAVFLWICYSIAGTQAKDARPERVRQVHFLPG